MPGHRFFVDASPNTTIGVGAVVILCDADAHHARDVLRLIPTATVTVIIKQSGECFDGVIDSIAPTVTIRLTAAHNALPCASRVERILFALCKGDRNDLVCEKATELGVGIVHFFQAERSVVRLASAAECEKKRSRWIKIAEGAAKQCGRASVPEIVVSRSLAEALSTCQTDSDTRLFFCSLSPGSQELRLVSPPPRLIEICVGPEGDFTPQEEELLRSRRGEPINLGPTVLRSETAAIAAISMALGVWGYASAAPARA